MKKDRKEEAINVVIVESHQHALEHYHTAIRKFKIFEPWSMIHFDAHPDLACPQCPAAACFSPRQQNVNLYELLDLSQTGIAEWIIPLVVAAELKRVDWIKPNFSLQFPLGQHVYKLGAYHDTRNEKTCPTILSFLDLPETAVIKTDFDTQYYHDDDAVVPSSDLMLPQTLELVVQELPSATSPLGSGDDLQKKWALDICLDYFACCNPFLSDIDKIQPAATETLLQLMRNAKAGKSSVEVKKNVASMLALENGSLSAVKSQLLEYFDSQEEAMAHLSALKGFTDKDSSLKSLVLKAIPNWDMPHDVSSADQQKIKTAIDQMEQYLRDCCTSSPPFLITICRSSDDEFTPPWLVEFIQQQVLQVLDRTFRDISGSKSLHVVKDYGEWEGSTILQ